MQHLCTHRDNCDRIYVELNKLTRPTLNVNSNAINMNLALQISSKQILIWMINYKIEFHYNTSRASVWIRHVNYMRRIISRVFY